MSVPSPGELLQSLATSLPDLVAEDLLQVETQRSMRERLAGQPGKAVAVKLLGPELTLTLSAPDGRRGVAEVAHVVRGVVISRRTVPVAEWLDLLAGQLRALAAGTATDDAAVTLALSTLGVAEPASDLVVDAGNVAAGLQTLPARLSGRVPEDVVATVGRICSLLLDTVGRVDAGDPQQSHTVLRAATDYLPRTLRGYVSLPAEWAQSHRIDGGGTALDALREQLTVLESAVSAMRDAAVSADAGQLLANGLFLTDRFGSSDL